MIKSKKSQNGKKSVAEGGAENGKQVNKRENLKCIANKIAGVTV